MPKFTKLGVVKLVISAVVATSVTKVTSDIISNNVEIDSSRDQFQVWVSSLVLGSVIAQLAANHVNLKIDEFVKDWEDRKPVKVEVVEVITDGASS
jgi:hypothetical protein